MRQKIVYILTFLIALIIGIIGTITVVRYLPSTNTVIEKTVKDITITESDTISSSIDKVNDAVVYIRSAVGRSISTGTGFFYKSDDEYGYILTNNHVVESSTEIEITTTAGSSYKATIVGADEFSDIAVLKVEKSAAIAVAEIGDSTKSLVGDTVFTVGSPLGIDYMNSVSKGIVSGTNRTVTVTLTSGDFLMDVLQFDASINPGNSGGPLCNINGEVIGVTSMKLVDSSVEGMGFAIPIEMAISTATQLESGLKVERPYLGLTMLSTSETWQLYRNGIYLDEDVMAGVVIVSVEENSPIGIAGLKKGDIITKIDGTNVSSVAKIRYLFYKHNIGDTVKLTYYRNSVESEVSIVLNKSVND